MREVGPGLGKRMEPFGPVSMEVEKRTFQEVYHERSSASSSAQ